jgi:hypothetical protein
VGQEGVEEAIGVAEPLAEFVGHFEGKIFGRGALVQNALSGLVEGLEHPDEVFHLGEAELCLHVGRKGLEVAEAHCCRWLVGCLLFCGCGRFFCYYWLARGALDCLLLSLSTLFSRKARDFVSVSGEHG